MNKVLLYFNEKYKGDFSKIYNAFENKEKILENDINLNNSKGYDYFSITDSNYPHPLKFSVEPPFLLFTVGKQEIIKDTERSITISGSDFFNKDMANLSNDFVEECIKNELTPYITPNNIFSRFLSEKLSENNVKHVLVLDTGIDDFTKENNDLVNKVVKTGGLVVSHALSMKGRDIVSIKDQVSQFNSLMTKGLMVFPFKREEKISNIKNATIFALNVTPIVSLRTNINDTYDMSDFKEIKMISSISEMTKKMNLDYNDAQLELIVKESDDLVKKYLKEYVDKQNNNHEFIEENIEASLEI